VPATPAATAEPTQAAAPAANAEPAPSPTPPAPARPQPIAPAYRTYTVQRGDSLKQIAARYGVSLASIMAINTIPNPDSLRVGQVLQIPPPGS
jgi:LysM repeat protein